MFDERPIPGDRPLLAHDEPAAAQAERADGRSRFVLACDHAGNVIPRQLDSLGLDPDTLQRHVAWDIGALSVARHLSALLDAPLVWQTYSRLVIDCNRGPWATDFIPEISEYTVIARNRGLVDADRHARVETVFAPYHQRLAAVLDARSATLPPVLVALHSFTPVYNGAARPWHIGILYNRDPRLASLLLDDLRRQGDLCVGDNQPYSVSDESDYTIPVHGEARGIPHVEIEIRQDLVADDAGQRHWAEQLAQCLSRAIDRLETTGVA